MISVARRRRGRHHPMVPIGGAGSTGGAGPMRRVCRAIVHDLDSRPTELLTAALSLWFAAVFLASDSPNRPQPVALWSLWCGCAGVCKIAGVYPTLVGREPGRWLRRVRVLGSLLGLIFWIVLAVALFLLARGGIAWGGYALIAVAQGLALYRLTRRA